jgi:hypothetical protein
MNARTRHFARRGAFLLTLGAAAVAALVPDWCVALKAQYYDSGVDLALGLTSSATTPVVAGTDLDLLFTAQNRGPNAATRPRVLLSLRGDVWPGATSGCNADPVGYPLCFLADPLAAGASSDMLLNTHVPPDARGSVQVIGAVVSDDTENLPGDEVAFFESQVVAQADISAVASCAPPYHRQRPVTCTYTFHNDGPSTSNASLSAGLLTTEGTMWTCTATRPELCPYISPGSSTPYFVQRDWQPGESITLVATGILSSVYDPLLIWNAFANQPFDETDTDQSNNWVTNQGEISLFFDDFGSN